MKAKLHFCVIALVLLAGVQRIGAQNAQFFRIVGPTATTITAVNLDGTVVWSGANPGATYQVQTAASLAGGGNWVDYIKLPVTNSINTNLLIAFNPPAGMVLIPAGEFTIGDTLDGIFNAPPANVMVSAFYMDVYLVAFSQWQSVYSYATNNGYGFVDAGFGKADNHPVTSVNWYDCAKWCNARSQQEGMTPVYYADTNLTQVYTNGGTPTNVYANWNANGYRLPTEAEWEKAARGGISGLRFPWGNTISETQANYLGCTNGCGFGYDFGPDNYNSAYTNGVEPYTSPVGSFPANGYGLYDMAGNVFEWCWDFNYAGPPFPFPPGSPYLGGTDPHGPVGPMNYRVLRGGGWDEYAPYERCANRVERAPYYAANDEGFRCVRGH
jgi:sulfatase modifying factor 1